MQIDMTDFQEQQLADRAAAHGYADVSAFVSQVLANIASLSDEAAVFAPLEEGQVIRSEQLLQQGEADLAAGRVQDMREGLIKLGKSRGLSLDE